MSSYEKTEYFMEAAGFTYGPELVVASLLTVSVVLGAVIASCILNRNKDSDTKQARKALAKVLNEGKISSKENGTGAVVDDMFDVPLNDACSFVGPEEDSDMLTSATSYVKAASKPSKSSRSRKYSNTVKVGNLTEDDEYSFECEI